MGKIYVSFPYSALKETLKCVSFRYYISLHNWYIDSTSVFNILQISPKNHYCKHERFKSKRRVKKFTEPIFPNLSDLSCISHRSIFFNYILRMYSMTEGFRNKSMSKKAIEPPGLSISATLQSLQASFSRHPPRH